MITNHHIDRDWILSADCGDIDTLAHFLLTGKPQQFFFAKYSANRFDFLLLWDWAVEQIPIKSREWKEDTRFWCGPTPYFNEDGTLKYWNVELEYHEPARVKTNSVTAPTRQLAVTRAFVLVRMGELFGELFGEIKVEIKFDELIMSLGECWRIRIGDKKYWLPKMGYCELSKKDKTILVPEWMALEVGLGG
jgi:hypothetical protein